MKKVRKKSKSPGLCVVYTTFSKLTQARSMAKKILLNKYAVCVQLYPKVESLYEWQGKMHQENEIVMVCKTLEDKSGELFDFLVKNHPYQVPLIGLVSLKKVNERYLNWALKI